MSYLDPILIQITPLNIFMLLLGYFFNKIIDLKAKRKFPNDLERLDYLGDTLVNTGVKQSKKVKGAIKSIMGENEVINSETIPNVTNVKAYQQEILKEIDDIKVTDGLIMSEMQLEIDHLKHKLIEAGIDVNNGEDKDNPILD